MAAVFTLLAQSMESAVFINQTHTRVVRLRISLMPFAFKFRSFGKTETGVRKTRAAEASMCRQALVRIFRRDSTKD